MADLLHEAVQEHKHLFNILLKEASLKDLQRLSAENTTDCVLRKSTKKRK